MSGATMENLKKQIVRGTQYIRTTVGGAHQTTDQEYTQWRTETERIQLATENLTKDFQAMIENLHTITKTMRNLSREFNTVYDNDVSDKFSVEGSGVRRCKKITPPKELGQFRNLSTELDSEVFSPLVNMLILFLTSDQQNEILDKVNVPIKEYLIKFNFFEEMHKKRDNLILDLDYYTDQLKQYEGAASKNNPPHKLYIKREQQKNLQAKYDFMTQNNKSSMKDVLVIREKTFDPSFDHFVQALRTFGTEFERVSSHYRFFNETVDFDAIVQRKSSNTSTGSDHDRPRTPVIMNRTTGWYYILDGSEDQGGPISFSELQNLYMFEKSINDNSQVYCNAVTNGDWKRVGEIKELRDALRAL